MSTEKAIIRDIINNIWTQTTGERITTPIRWRNEEIPLNADNLNTLTNGIIDLKTATSGSFSKVSSALTKLLERMDSFVEIGSSDNIDDTLVIVCGDHETLV
jgi:hypothetical protein